MGIYSDYLEYVMIHEAAEGNLIAVKSEMEENCDIHNHLYEIFNPKIKPSIPFTIKILFILKPPGKKIDYIETESGNKIYGGDKWK